MACATATVCYVAEWETAQARERLSSLIIEGDDKFLTSGIVTTEESTTAGQNYSLNTLDCAIASDVWPCTWCGGGHGHADMVLCDHCNYCYHRDCVVASGGIQMHDEPQLYLSYLSYLIHYRHDDVMHDCALYYYLQLGLLPDDLDESERIVRLAQEYRALGNELQDWIPASEMEPE